MEKQENEKIEKDKKSLQKVILIVIAVIILLVIIGIVVYARITEDNCIGNTTNGNSNNQGEGAILIPSDKDKMVAYKPVIYLYPQETTELSVELGNPEKITCSYPKYKEEWKVIAEPDGMLTDIETQRKLYALYWEGKEMPQPEMTEGFIVKGEDTIEFLEEKLEILGLNEREAEEFIIYWLPKMQNNKYNYIRFATMEEINEYMPLEFSVQPDSIIRVLMQFKAIDEYIEIPEQKLETPKREGFVVVEWGGSEIK